MLDMKSIHRSIRVLHKSSFLANFWSNYKRSTHLVKYLRDSVQLDVSRTNCKLRFAKCQLKIANLKRQNEFYLNQGVGSPGFFGIECSGSWGNSRMRFSVLLFALLLNPIFFSRCCNPRGGLWPCRKLLK